MKSLFYILFACIESRFIDIDFLHKWTESLIIKSKKPQNWLLDLTICSDSESALNTLRKYLSLSNDILDNEYGEILIGFFYLCYKKNTISFDEFISEVIDVSDAYEIETFNFEELLQIHKRGNIASDYFQRLLLEKFGRYGEKSNFLYMHLTNENLYQKEQNIIEDRAT